MKLKTEEGTGKSQFGCRPGRGTVDATFIVRQVIEKAKDHRVQLHFNFADFNAPKKMITLVLEYTGLTIATAERRASDCGDWCTISRLERARE